MGFFRNLFKSKEERAQELKYALRSANLSFTRWDNALEKRRQHFIELAKKARESGSDANYKLTVKGIHLVNIAQNRARSIVIQMEVYSTMCEIGHMSNSFVSLLGKAGKDIQRVIGSQDFLGNFSSFEKSIHSMGSSFENLEVFLSKAMNSMEDGIDAIDTVSDEEITRMIDAELGAKEIAGADEDLEYIKNLAKEWSGKSSGGSPS